MYRFTWIDIENFVITHVYREDVVAFLLTEIRILPVKRRSDRFNYDFWWNKGKELPLYFAIWSNASISVLYILISCYPQALVERDGGERTPLHFSYALPQPVGDVIKLLAIPEAICTRDSHNLLALYLLCDSVYPLLIDLDVVRFFTDSFPESICEWSRRGNSPEPTRKSNSTPMKRPYSFW